MHNMEGFKKKMAAVLDQATSVFRIKQFYWVIFN